MFRKRGYKVNKIPFEYAPFQTLIRIFLSHWGCAEAGRGGGLVGVVGWSGWWAGRLVNARSCNVRPKVALQLGQDFTLGLYITMLFL
jgi:hypothetical protein